MKLRKMPGWAGIAILTASLVLPAFLMAVHSWWWYFLYAVELHLVNFHTEIMFGPEPPPKAEPERPEEPETAREAA